MTNYFAKLKYTCIFEPDFQRIMKKNAYILFGLGIAFMAFLSLAIWHGSAQTASSLVENSSQLTHETVMASGNSAAWLFETVFHSVFQNL